MCQGRRQSMGGIDRRCATASTTLLPLLLTESSLAAGSESVGLNKTQNASRGQGAGIDRERKTFVGREAEARTRKLVSSDEEEAGTAAAACTSAGPAAPHIHSLRPEHIRVIRASTHGLRHSSICVLSQRPKASTSSPPPQDRSVLVSGSQPSPPAIIPI